MMTRDEIVSQLQLLPHPEGGFYSEIYRGKQVIPQAALGPEYNGDRNISTSIYFMLTRDSFSAFHKVTQDEAWHFYYGAPLTLHIVHPNGDLESIELGMNLSHGERPQFTVPGGSWFAAESHGEYTLVGCTVAPGFDFADFTLAHRQSLTEDFPQHAEIIERFTRQ
ncbi:MAG: hypothetical protein SchgKO_15770 [Schleiferiaceae bacterium]